MQPVPDEYIMMVDGQGNPIIYRTDYDIVIRFFGNPVTWLTFHLFWDSMNGYGIRFGPLLLMLQINKFIKFYKNEN